MVLPHHHGQGRVDPKQPCAEGVRGHPPLATIDDLALREWVADLSGRLAPASVHKTFKSLTKMLRSAVDVGMLVRNPADGVPPSSTATATSSWGTADLVNDALDALAATATDGTSSI